MSSLEILEKSLAESEKTITSRILHTYGMLNKEFMMLKSRITRSLDYNNLLDVHSQEECGAADGLDMNKNSKLVKLNVGGEVHIIKRRIMLSVGDHMSFLYTMISGRWHYLLPKDCKGIIFVDLDPALFEPIFDKLRYRSNCSTNEPLIQRVPMEKRFYFNAAVLYYKMGGIVHSSTALSVESEIECMNDPKNILLLHSFLPSDFIKMRLKLELLYRGSRDGMKAAAFHRMCDGKNDTVSVIKDTNGNVFGGFADKAWSSQESSVKSEKSFLFSLKSSLGNHAVKFPVDTRDPNSLRHHPSCMCAFGSTDLYIGDPENSNSTIDIRKAYKNPSSTFSASYCTGGHKTFAVHEIEVYQIIHEVFESPDRFHSNDLPISLISSIKTEQSALEAMSESVAVSNAYSTQTSDFSSNLLLMAKGAQIAEEELLLELMWIEHLSVPMKKRNLSAGLSAEWRRKCDESADVLPLSNGVVVTSCRSETLERIEESMARLGMKVGPKRKRDCSEGPTTSSGKKSPMSNQVDIAVDDVISFNVGGKIIAVLRSTLLLQAPRSTFAANYSDRWIQRSDALDECGNIYMVKETFSFYITSYFPVLSLSLLAFTLLSFLHTNSNLFHLFAAISPFCFYFSFLLLFHLFIVRLHRILL